MTRLLLVIVSLTCLVGPLWAQASFFRSYNHAPWWSDGQRVVIYNDSVVIGQSRAVDTTGNFGFALVAYSPHTGDVVDSVRYILYRETTYVESMVSSGECLSLLATELTMQDYPLRMYTWQPGQDSVSYTDVPYNHQTLIPPSISYVDGGQVLSEPSRTLTADSDYLDYNGTIRRYDACGELIRSDTILRDTTGYSQMIANVSDPNKYFIRDFSRSNLMLVQLNGMNAAFTKVKRYPSNVFHTYFHYDEKVVADRFMYYERDGYDLYDETVAVYDEELNMVWQAPFVPDRTELRPSYWSESRAIHVGEEYITIVGAEGFDHGIPNFLNRVNRLYSTRYSLDGTLIWHRKYDMLDSVLPAFWANDIALAPDGSIFSYGYYTHRTPAACDTCPITRNTFLLKLDPDGYLDGRPTATEEEYGPGATTVYPNPATDHITVRSDYQIARTTLLRLDGSVVRSEVVGAAKRSEVVVSDVPARLYVLMVRDVEGRVSSHKVVVLH